MTFKILLAYDGSAGAQEAVRQATELAGHYAEAEVTLFTVGGPLMPADNAQPTYRPHMSEQDYEQLAGEGLNTLATNGIIARKMVRWLDPADEILREAREGEYDLIIMGHRGANQSLRRDQGLLGSVAIKVINHAPCSVLIVRPRPASSHYLAAAESNKQLTPTKSS